MRLPEACAPPMLVWQDVSLQQEAIAAAKEMLGMDRGQRFALCVLVVTQSRYEG